METALNDSQQTETYKSLVTISVEALKTLVLVNGGAAVAVLTYLGNLAAKTNTPSGLPSVRGALLAYCGGLALALVAFVLSYLTQLRLLNEHFHPEKKQRHGYLLWAGITVAVLSASAFFVGCLFAAAALTNPG